MWDARSVFDVFSTPSIASEGVSLKLAFDGRAAMHCHCVVVCLPCIIKSKIHIWRPAINLHPILLDEKKAFTF